MSEFGPVLKTMRERRGLSQAALARRAALDHSYVSRLEAAMRNPTRDVVTQIGEAMNLMQMEQDQLLVAAGFAGSQVVSPSQLSEARSHLVSALALLGGG